MLAKKSPETLEVSALSIPKVPRNESWLIQKSFDLGIVRLLGRGQSRATLPNIHNHAMILRDELTRPRPAPGMSYACSLLVDPRASGFHDQIPQRAHCA